MLHWQQDPDLAGIRDAAALAKLPGEEQKACTQLWADVAELLEEGECTTEPRLAPGATARGPQSTPQGQPATGRPARSDRLGPAGAEEMDRGRAASPRVPGHPREDAADAWSTFNTKSVLGGASWARRNTPRPTAALGGSRE